MLDMTKMRVQRDLWCITKLLMFICICRVISEHAQSSYASKTTIKAVLIHDILHCILPM